MTLLSRLSRLISHSSVRNERGQGLIEYLVIVALVGIASISIMRVIGQNVKARFGNISTALGASTARTTLESADSSAMGKSDLTDFMNGAKSKNGSRSSGDRRLSEGSGDESGGW